MASGNFQPLLLFLTGGAPMRLIAVYVVFVLTGCLIAFGAGRLAEMWSEQASLIVFLGLFFTSLWASWKLALRVT
jgi:hypothetical protein